MASPYSAAVFPSRPRPQHHPTSTSDNQWDDSIGYPQPCQSSPSDATRFFSKHDSEWDGPAARKLRDENHALRMQLAELARVHEERVGELEAQLADANKARVEVEQRLQAVPALRAGYSTPPVVQQVNPSQHHVGAAPQRWAGGYQPQRFNPPLATPQVLSAPTASLQSKEVYFKQQKQQHQQPVHSVSSHLQPDVPLPEDTGRATKVLAYCSDFISSSLHSSATPSAFKVAPSWKLFGRSHSDDIDEEMGRVHRR